MVPLHEDVEEEPNGNWKEWLGAQATHLSEPQKPLGSEW